MTIIVIGFAMIVLLMLAVLVSASRVYLTERDLVASADAAASSAAQAVSEAAVFGGPPGSELPIDAADAESRVRDYVVAAGLPEKFDQFAITSVIVDGTSVTVTLSARSAMPFGGVLSSDWEDGYPLTASATARSPFTF